MKNREIKSSWGDFDEGTKVESRRLHLYLDSEDAFQSHLRFKRYLNRKDTMLRLSDEVYCKIITEMITLGLLYRINDRIELDGADEWPFVEVMDEGYCNLYNNISNLLAETFDFDYTEDIMEEIIDICSGHDAYTFIQNVIDAISEMEDISHYAASYDGDLVISMFKVHYIKNMDMFYGTWNQELLWSSR